MRYSLYYLLGLLLSLSSCGVQSDRLSSLQKASGALEEILIVQDSLGWKGSVGEALREQIRIAHPGIISPEPYFNTAYIPAEHFGGIFIKHHFILIPTTLSQIESIPAYKQLISRDALSKVSKEETLIYKKTDVYASGQTIVFIVALEEYYLEEYFKEQGSYLREVLSNELMQHYADRLKEKEINTNLLRRVKEERGFDIKMPSEFEVALQNESFIWFRNAAEVDQSILIQKLEYTSKSQFTEQGFIALRDSITGKHVLSEDTNSHLETELLSPPLFRTEQDENGGFKKMAWGLWKMKNKAMGGSFVSMLYKSPENNDLYYVEGFIYAPGVEKLNYIRKLESIIRTFEPILE